MKINKELFLKRLTKLPELKDNKLAFILANNLKIDISKKEKFFENLQPFYKNFNKGDFSTMLSLHPIIEEFSNSLTKDFRIKKLKLKSVRGLPNQSKPFGIEFSNVSNIPMSLVILGANGSGKSTIYNSLEYSYSKKISEANHRSPFDIEKEKELKEYLCHYNIPFSECLIDLETVGGDFSLQKETMPFQILPTSLSQSHFINENSICKNGHLDYDTNSDNSFHQLVANNLGLTELLEIENYLSNFSRYNKTSLKTLSISLEKQILIETETNSQFTKAIESKTLEINKLKENVSFSKTDDEYLSFISKLKNKHFHFASSFENINTVVQLFIEKYEQYSTIEGVNQSERHLYFYNLGLELLKTSSDCPLCSSSTNTPANITNHLKIKILELEQESKLRQELSLAYDNLSSSLQFFANQVASLKNLTLSEFNIIKNYSSTSSLVQLENIFLTEIETLQSSNFYSSLNDLKENEAFYEKAKKLFTLLKENLYFLQKDLSPYVEGINLYIKNREQIINELVEKESNTSTINVNEKTYLLENEISNLKKLQENSLKRSNELAMQLNASKEESHLFETIKLENKAYKDVFNKEISKIVANGFSPIKDTIEEILKDFLKATENKNDELKISWSEDIDFNTGEVLSSTLSAKIIQKENLIPIPIKKYFNTFRYNLFCTMVSISMAITSRNESNTNIPLFIDDIFHSSDFENSAKIEKLIMYIFKVFEKYSPHLPLQLVFFTHDHFIFDSILKTSISTNRKDIKFAKLLPHEEAKDSFEYCELTYSIPTLSQIQKSVI